MVFYEKAKTSSCQVHVFAQNMYTVQTRANASYNCIYEYVC